MSVPMLLPVAALWPGWMARTKARLSPWILFSFPSFSFPLHTFKVSNVMLVQYRAHLCMNFQEPSTSCETKRERGRVPKGGRKGDHKRLSFDPRPRPSVLVGLYSSVPLCFHSFFRRSPSYYTILHLNILCHVATCVAIVPSSCLRMWQCFDA